MGSDIELGPLILFLILFALSVSLIHFMRRIHSPIYVLLEDFAKSHKLTCASRPKFVTSFILALCSIPNIFLPKKLRISKFKAREMGCYVTGNVNKLPFAILMNPGNQKGGPYIIGEVQIEKLPDNVYIFTKESLETCNTPFRNLKKMQDMEIDDKKFEKIFHIKGEKNEEIENYLTFNKKKALLEMFGSSPKTGIMIHGDKLYIQKELPVVNRDEAKLFFKQLKKVTIPFKEK